MESLGVSTNIVSRLIASVFVLGAFATGSFADEIGLNGGFESGTSPWVFTTTGGGTAMRTGDAARTGSFGVLLDSTNGTASVSQTVAVPEGYLVGISAWIRVPAGSIVNPSVPGIGFTVELFDAMNQSQGSWSNPLWYDAAQNPNGNWGFYANFRTDGPGFSRSGTPDTRFARITLWGTGFVDDVSISAAPLEVPPQVPLPPAAMAGVVTLAGLGVARRMKR
jgi:hypothetical protein